MTGLSRWRRAVHALPGFSLLSLVKNVAAGGDARATALLRWRKPTGLLQPSGHTEPDRYPELFTRLRDLVGAGAPVTVLSFGCSTGEEIETVLRYFPAARVRGLDIDPGRVAAARVRLADRPGVSLACAASARDESRAAYDIVLAMAVLRHGDLNARPATSSRSMTFAAFRDAIMPLIAALKPGGYLAVRHANFRVLDVPGAGLEAVYELPAWGPLYGPDDQLTADNQEVVLFRKR